MKISQMTNDQAAECLVRISEPIGRICDDEKLVELLDAVTKAENETLIRQVGKLLPKIITYAMSNHKADFYAIVAALGDVPEEKMSEMPFVETVKIIRDSYDDVLVNFFTQSAKATKTPERT